MFKERYTGRITVLSPQMCFLIPSLVQVLILMRLHTRKFQKIIQDFTLWGFELLFTSFWNSSLLGGAKLLSVKEKLEKSETSRKHRTIAAPALVNLCWWITVPHTLHFTQTKAVKKSLLLLFLSYKVSLNDLTSLDLDTIIWCLGENYSSLVALCAWIFCNRAML